MDLSSFLIAIVIIVVVIFIMKMLLKTIKWIFIFTVVVLVLGVWFYGFGDFWGKVSDVSPEIPEFEKPDFIEDIHSLRGCSNDLDCIYINQSSNCGLVEGYCNNVVNDENYLIKEGNVTEMECNRTSVVIDPSIECYCDLHKQNGTKLNEFIEEKVGYTLCRIKK